MGEIYPVCTEPKTLDTPQRTLYLLAVRKAHRKAHRTPNLGGKQPCNRPKKIFQVVLLACGVNGTPRKRSELPCRGEHCMHCMKKCSTSCGVYHKPKQGCLITLHHRLRVVHCPLTARPDTEMNAVQIWHELSHKTQDYNQEWANQRWPLPDSRPWCP